MSSERHRDVAQTTEWLVEAGDVGGRDSFRASDRHCVAAIVRCFARIQPIEPTAAACTAQRRGAPHAAGIVAAGHWTNRPSARTRRVSAKGMPLNASIVSVSNPALVAAALETAVSSVYAPAIHGPSGGRRVCRDVSIRSSDPALSSIPVWKATAMPRPHPVRRDRRRYGVMSTIVGLPVTVTLPLAFTACVVALPASSKADAGFARTPSTHNTRLYVPLRRSSSECCTVESAVSV